MLNEDLFLGDFAPVFSDGAASLCLPNEREGGLSALFPAPLLVWGFQPRCLHYSALCFWVSRFSFPSYTVT